MVITWKDGTYKYRTAQLAYINNVRVAAITWQSSAPDFNAVCLLPGLPKTGNRFKSSSSAREAMEKRIEQWFNMVQQ